jgi:hypothetical protein
MWLFYHDIFAIHRPRTGISIHMQLKWHNHAANRSREVKQETKLGMGNSEAGPRARLFYSRSHTRDIVKPVSRPPCMVMICSNRVPSSERR